VSEPTAGERTLAPRLRLDPSKLAVAREALNAIAALPWPPPERVSLLARIAKSVGADVGPIIGRLALSAAPLASFDALVPISGIGLKRVAGLARALSTFDVVALTGQARELADAKATIAALTARIAAVQADLDRLRAAPAAGAGGPAAQPGLTVMRIADVAASLGNQVALVDHVLRSRPNGVRLGAVDLRLTGMGTALGSDLALDLGYPSGGSAIGIAFVPSPLDAVGGQTAQVPDVRGYTTALARRKLLGRGFDAIIITSTGSRGVVTDQSPEPGTVAPAGTAVRLMFREAEVRAVTASDFVSQTVPALMIAGSSYTVSITMRNTGNTTWTPNANAPVGLGAAHDTTRWGPDRHLLAAPVRPGEIVTFTFRVLASTPGSHPFQWRMVQGSSWFGAVTPNVIINVVPSVYDKNLVSGIGGEQL